MSKRYQYIVGIDLGTFSSSFSFAHVDEQENIVTITEWEQKSTDNFGGRVASSVTYQNDFTSLPLWGEKSNKEENHLFHASRIKLYLTDPDNQPTLPQELKAVKLVSDYLKQLHQYGVSKMIDHFRKTRGIDDKNNLAIEDQIRYVVSFPDNKEEDYKKVMKEALIMAGIIKKDDPEHRLLFTTESEATAYYCLKKDFGPKKPSLKPYLVCDIGGTVFGVSTIEARELFETGKVNSHIDKSAGSCGKIRLKMDAKKYIEHKIPGPENDLQLNDIRKKLYGFYKENIKKKFNQSIGDVPCPLGDAEIPDSIAKLDCIEDNFFVFTQKDLQSEVFGHLTNDILKCIENSMDTFSNGIGGIFLSGMVGSETYLEEVVQERFKNKNIKVYSVPRSAFAISEGLVSYGFREKDFMVPFLIGKKVSKIDAAEHNQSEPGNTLKRLNLEKLDYIIGLDFGTTYSGFAYAPVPKSDKKEDNDHNLIIKNIKTWPKQSHSNFAKVPSALLYNDKMEYKDKFGDEAILAATKRNTKDVLLKHFKLLLCNSFDLTADAKDLANLDNFDVVDAVSNYFRIFTKEGIKRMAKVVPVSEETRFGYVVSVPSVWSHEAKNTLMAAVKNADFEGKTNKEELPKRTYVTPPDFDDNFLFITEAEADAIYCEKYFKNEFRMDRQQRFMICDAGGGTVDLATFEVGHEGDAEGDTSLVELTSSDYDNCGSSYLDEKFRQFILKKFDELNIKQSERGIENIVDQFKKEIKANFEPSLVPDLEDDIKLQIPMSLGIDSDFTDDSGFIVSSEISIKYTDMENQVFQPIIDRTLNVIEKQLKKLPEGERQLDAILIVGGFGQSSYLHKAIIDRFENKLVGAKFIGKPPNGDLATSRGAVSFGLEPKTVSTNISRYMYGLQVKDRFREKTDSDDQKVQGYNGELYCQNVFSSIVLRETKISRGTVYVHDVYVLYPNDPIFAIYVTDGTSMPRFTTSMSPVCKISAAMPDIPGIQEGDKVLFKVSVEISSTDIYVNVYYDGRLLKQEDRVVKSKAIVRHCKPQRKGSIWTVPVFIPPPKN